MKTFIVDSFTDAAFKGNPAGVCLVEKALKEETMLSVAKELNFSETAFVQAGKKEGQYSIRYFSPKMEIPLCGHATLAAAKVLFEKSNLSQIDFINIDGLILNIKKKGIQIEMTFPVYDLLPAKVSSPLLAALGIKGFLHCAYNKETNILLIEIADKLELANLQPDFQALFLAHDSINGVLLTARSQGDPYHFYSRYFWPWSGTNEDPVTGGTHTFLAKYWADKLGITKLKSFQCSPRSGFMEVEVHNDDKQVLIRGEAVLVLEGSLVF